VVDFTPVISLRRSYFFILIHHGDRLLSDCNENNECTSYG
jgi:hypothetical protein